MIENTILCHKQLDVFGTAKTACCALVISLSLNSNAHAGGTDIIVRHKDPVVADVPVAPQVNYSDAESDEVQPDEMIRDFIAPDYDVHYLTDDIKHFLDVEVAHIRSKKQRFLKLHDVLYKSHYLNLMYNPSGTYTAAETFRKGYGNCMSHANLFVAAARYVGLKAYYQTVEVPLEWRPRQGFYELPGHVNVVLKLGHYNATVEFNQAIFEEYDMTNLKKEIISDEQAKAEFYNNLGVEALTDNQYYKAVAFFEKAIDTYKKLDISWSNLGVVNKKIGPL